jgi:hypothetical protein
MGKRRRRNKHRPDCANPIMKSSRALNRTWARLCPSNAPHYIENTGDTDAVFPEMLASDVFEDVSLNQWLRRVPAQMVQAAPRLRSAQPSQDSRRKAHRRVVLGECWRRSRPSRPAARYASLTCAISPCRRQSRPGESKLNRAPSASFTGTRTPRSDSTIPPAKGA